MRVRFIIEINESLESWGVETNEELLKVLRAEIANDPADYIDAVMDNPDFKITVEPME